MPPGAKTNSKEKPENGQEASPPLVETTRVEKEITCPAGAKAQDKIRGLLFEHLQAELIFSIPYSSVFPVIGTL